MKKEETLRWGARGGMVVGALLATACCWVPLSLAVAGLTMVGVGATLEAWRPLFLVMTFALMAWAFWEAFLRRPVLQPCAVDDGCAPAAGGCSKRQRSARWFFVGHALLVVGLFALPMLPMGSGVAIASGGEERADFSEVETVALALQVEGMTCMGCVNGVTQLLEREVGVHAVDVTLRPGRADLRINPELTSAAALIAALEAAGYGAAEIQPAEAPNE